MNLSQPTKGFVALDYTQTHTPTAQYRQCVAYLGMGTLARSFSLSFFLPFSWASFSDFINADYRSLSYFLSPYRFLLLRFFVPSVLFLSFALITPKRHVSVLSNCYLENLLR
jgi:hypothetical protein